MKRFIKLTSLAACALVAAVHVEAQLLSPVLPAREVVARAAAPPVAAAAAAWAVTNNNDSGPGSLREAISNAAAGDTIQFTLHLPATIELKSSLIIDKDVTIAGPGPKRLTVERSSSRSFRVFEINGGSVTISGLKIQNGRALNPDGNADNLGGGILNWGTLTISNCVVTDNEAPTANGGIGYGGGIFTVGALAVLNSTIDDNKASAGGGGIYVFDAPSLVLEGSTVSGNEAGIQGGGLGVQGTTGHIRNSTISGNEAEDDGVASALLVIGFAAENADLALSSVTIADNEDDRSGATNAAVVVAALPGSLGARLRLISTLVADNEPRNFATVREGTIVSLGNNLDSDGSSGFVNAVNGDIVGTEASPIDARLDDLEWNGGLTRTHALELFSPALNAGSCNDAFGAPVATDQRGYPRPQGGGCDIGAFENQGPTIVCPDITTIDCKDDLRITVSDADGDRLVVVWTVDGTIVETNSVSTDPGEDRKVKLKTALSAGTHTVTIAVMDASGGFATCATTITVQDTKPPKIKDIKATPKSLKPATGELVSVSLQVKADDCSAVESQIVSVKSNQAAGGEEPDWVITGPLTVDLRAERTGNKERVYTVTVEARDSAGNTSRDTVTVKVKKSGGDHDDD
jgi:hypothetical protein